MLEPSGWFLSSALVGHITYWNCEAVIAKAQNRDTYRHGNIRSEAVSVGIEMVREQGYESLSVRRIAGAMGVVHRSLYNHFVDREALLDAIAERGFESFGVGLKKCKSPKEYVSAFINFALDNPSLYDLMQSRPHATMKEKPELQAAVHIGIGEAMRLFSKPENSKIQNRRAVMKVMVLLHGGLAMYRAGVLDLLNDKALIVELQRMIAE